MGILRSNREGNTEILHSFLAPAPGGIPEIYGLYSSRGGVEGGVFCFGHVICFPAKEADMADDMADSNAVGINEMFRRLRSAKLSHVADSFIGK